MGNESLLIWGLALLGLSLVLLAAEMFIPSGGALGVAAALCALGGVGVLFYYDALWGAVGLAGVLVLGPIVIGFAFRVWPHTPMGRRIIGAPTEEDLALAHKAEEARRAEERSLVGKEGIVLTDLRPVGVIEVDGSRREALAETQYIGAGTRVRVVHASGGQIRVRAVP